MLHLPAGRAERRSRTRKEEGVQLGVSMSELANKHTRLVVAPLSTVGAQRRSRRHVRETIALDSALEDAGRIIWQSCSGITVRFFQCRGHSQTVPRSASGGSNAARELISPPPSPPPPTKIVPLATPRYGS